LLILSVVKAYSLSDGLRRSRHFDFHVSCFKHGVTAGGVIEDNQPAVWRLKKIDAEVNESREERWDQSFSELRHRVF